METETSKQPDETARAGTPRDYSEDLYRFYFELVDCSGLAKRIIMDFLGEKHSKSLIDLADGYEFDMPIQCAPEIVRMLARENVAVYQVVRLAKTNGVWQENSQNS
jgi:hypothetical protein